MTEAAWALESSEHLWSDLHSRPDPHATRTARMADYHDLPAHVLFDPDAACPGVAIVDPDQADAWEATFDRLQQEFHPLAVLDISSMHDHLEQQPHRADEQVPFAPRELLPPIIAVGSAALRGFDRLAINDHTAGGGFAPGLHAQSLAQRRHDLFPDPGIAPLAKVIVDRRPGRIVVR